jgi:nucleoside-diphosphate-sugar epimerase
VEALLERGFTVRCLVRAGSPAPAEPDPRADPRVLHHVVEYAVPEGLGAATVLDGATHVFHLAGVTRGRSMADFRRGNVLPVESLLGALERRRVPVRRFVHVSSQAAAGPAASLARPVREADPPAPIEFYGRSKAEAEGVVQRYSGSIPCTVVRPPAVYGPGDRDFLVLFRMLRWRLSAHAGRRDAYLSMVYVDDLVEGMIDAALSPRTAGGTYFLAREEPERWGNVHRIVAGIAGRRPLRVDVPGVAVAAAGRAGDAWARLTGRTPLLTSQKAALARPRYWICSSEEARRAFGFRAPTALEDGLPTTYRWYREHGWLR